MENKAPGISQNQLKQLARLLGLWQRQFEYSEERASESQPLYSEIVYVLIRQVRRELDEQL